MKVPARLLALASLTAILLGTAAMTLAARRSIWPQPNAEESERFVDWLYERYRHGPGAAEAWSEERVYSNELRTLFARYRQLAETYGIEDEELSMDPLCRCRDASDIALLERTARSNMVRTEVAVRFRNQGVEQRLGVWLQGSREGVRVVNVVGDDRMDNLRNRYQLRIRRIQIAHGLPTD